jgi:hypothetical protein
MEIPLGKTLLRARLFPMWAAWGIQVLRNHCGEWCVARAKLYALGSLRKGLVHFLACLGACSRRPGALLACLGACALLACLGAYSWRPCALLACLGAYSQRAGPMGPSSRIGSSGLGPTNRKP